jgi:hypothetical protein
MRVAGFCGAHKDQIWTWHNANHAAAKAVSSDSNVGISSGEIGNDPAPAKAGL